MNIKLKKIPGNKCADCAVRQLLRDSDKRLQRDAENICRDTDCKGEKVIYKEIK